MELYRNMYAALFNAVTDALEAMAQHDFDRAGQILVAAQQKTEEMFMTDAGISAGR